VLPLILARLIFRLSFRYGIEGIAQTYEDPFGVAKIDINMDDIVEDARREVEALLLAWQTQGQSGGIFRPYFGGEIQGSESNSSEYYSGEGPGQSAAPVFVVSDMSGDAHDKDGLRSARKASAVSPGMTRGSNGNDFFGLEEDLITESTASSQDRLVVGRSGGAKKVAWDDD
jgi:putative membrane protein